MCQFLFILSRVCVWFGLCFTLILTSLAFGGATSTSSMDRGFPGSQATAALHLITWKSGALHAIVNEGVREHAQAALLDLPLSLHFCPADTAAAVELQPCKRSYSPGAAVL